MHIKSTHSATKEKNGLSGPKRSSVRFRRNRPFTVFASVLAIVLGVACNSSTTAGSLTISQAQLKRLQEHKNIVAIFAIDEAGKIIVIPSDGARPFQPKFPLKATELIEFNAIAYSVTRVNPTTFCYKTTDGDWKCFTW